MHRRRGGRREREREEEEEEEEEEVTYELSHLQQCAVSLKGWCEENERKRTLTCAGQQDLVFLVR